MRQQDLLARAPDIAAAIVRKLSEACEQVDSHLDEQTNRAARDVEGAAFQSLKERYKLLHDVTRTVPAPIRLEARMVRPDRNPDLTPVFDKTVRTFNQKRIGFGLGGAAAGAAAGTSNLPGIGSAAGAILGACATFAKTLASVKRECASTTNSCVASYALELSHQIEALEPKIAAAIRASVSSALTQAIDRFARWIVEPLEAERAAIESRTSEARSLANPPPSPLGSRHTARLAHQGGRGRVRRDWRIAASRTTMRAMPLAEDFAAAQVRVKQLARTPSNDELLELYSLYKQAPPATCKGVAPVCSTSKVAPSTTHGRSAKGRPRTMR